MRIGSVVREIRRSHITSILQINGAAQPGVAALDAAELNHLASLGAVILVVEASGAPAGYLIAFPDTSEYDGVEFRHFRTRLPRPFVYIDQIAIHSEYRRRGLAVRLYEALSTHHSSRPPAVQCCEINLTPPNPDSMAFHTALGFRMAGELAVPDGRIVALMVRHSSDHHPHLKTAIGGRGRSRTS